MNSSPTFWVRYAARINALSLRERGILFGSTMLVVGALADTLVLSPAYAEQQQIKTKLSKLGSELTALRAQVGSSLGSQAGAAAEKDTPRAALLAAIQQTQQAKSAMDEQLKHSLASPSQVARLPDLMAKVMRQQPSLTLAKLATIAPDQDRTLIDKITKIYQPAAVVSGASPGPDSTPATSQKLAVQVHGVDIGVAGPYLELTRYLSDLELALPGLRWGELHLHADPGNTNTPLLHVRVYLMGAPS